MKLHRIIILAALIVAAFQPSQAEWRGRGEIVGEVTASRSTGYRVVFSLNISGQTIDEGPQLETGSTFSFDGAGRVEITEGDVVRLSVDSSDAYGIKVKKIEFIENKPGAAEESSIRERSFLSDIWRVVLLTSVLSAAAVFWLRRRRQWS